MQPTESEPGEMGSAVDSTGASAQVFPRPRTPEDDGVGLQAVLHLARAHLGMEVAWISQFQGDEYLIREISGDPTPMNIPLDTGMPLAGSFCVRVLAGTLPTVVPEA